MTFQCHPLSPPPSPQWEHPRLFAEEEGQYLCLLCFLELFFFFFLTGDGPYDGDLPGRGDTLQREALRATVGFTETLLQPPDMPQVFQ